MSITRTYVEPPPLKRLLSYGKRGEDVKEVQEILQAEGCFDGTPMGNYLSLTRDAVKYFQNTHIGEDGKPLEVDGKVGPLTWWALHNPNGDAQRNFIPTLAKPAAPAGPRAKIVAFLYALHAKGVAEIPNGSNYGDGVTAIVNACGFKYGIAWCMALVSYAFKQVTGSGPLGAMHVSCYQFWNKAMDEGKAHLKAGYTPIPGDIAIYSYGRVYSNGKFYSNGHALVVVRVSESGKSFNAIEGNAGNRLKHSIRNESEGTLVGYVNLFGDEKNPPNFRKGITQAPVVTLTLAESR